MAVLQRLGGPKYWRGVQRTSRRHRLLRPAAFADTHRGSVFDDLDDLLE